MKQNPADVLRNTRIARGFASAAEAARYYGWNVPTYTSHENGTRGLRRDVAQQYARAFGIDPAGLLGLTSGSTHFDADQGVNVVGTAAWGVWRDNTMLSVKHMDAVQVPQSGKNNLRAAVVVGDESVNKILQPGEIAIYEPVNGTHTIASGKFLVVKRWRGDLEELSIRRVLTALDGELRLTDHSTSHAFRETLTVPQEGTDEVEIVGIVVGRYTPL